MDSTAKNIQTTLLGIASLVAMFNPLATVGADRSGTPNIVIDSQEETVRLIADKSGENVAEMKRLLKADFKANFDDGHALDYISYDLYTRIDKVTAPKAQKSYGSAYGNGIFYSDSKACIVKFPVTVKGGATLEVERTTTDPDFFSGDVIGEVYQVNKLKLTYLIPESLRDNFTYEVVNGDKKLLGVDETKEGRDCRITFTFDTIPAISDEPFSAPMRYWSPQVIWRGLYPDAQAVYRKLRTYASAPDTNNGAVASLAASIVKDCTTDYEKIAAINDWVHSNIRYIAVEYGELGRKPESASVVAANRYGDCKGSANLTKELLKAVGIDGRLVWIATNSFPYAWSDVPTLGSGNHMIAAAVVGDSITFIDGTATNFPLGLYPRSIQGQEAMIENGETCLLKKVPMLAPEVNSMTDTRINYTITDDLELSGDYRSMLSGHDRVSMLSTLEGFGADRRADLLGLVVVGKRPGLHASAPAITRTTPDQIEVTATISGPGSLKKVGSKLRLSLTPDADIENYVIDVRNRKMPIWINRRQVNRSVVTLAIPEGYSIEKLPQSKSVSTAWLEGDVDFAVDDSGRNLTCTANWSIKDPVVSASDAKEFAGQLRQLQRAFNASVTLVETGDDASNE